MTNIHPGHNSASKKDRHVSYFLGITQTTTRTDDQTWMRQPTNEHQIDFLSINLLPMDGRLENSHIYFTYARDLIWTVVVVVVGQAVTNLQLSKNIMNYLKLPSVFPQ